MHAFGYARQRLRGARYLKEKFEIFVIRRNEEGSTFSAHVQIDNLHNVHKGFVFLILDVSAPPARSPRRLCRNLRGFFLQCRLSRRYNDWEQLTTGIAAETMLSVVIYVLRVSISLFCG